LAGVQAEVHVLEHVEVAEVLVDLLHLEQGRPCRHCHGLPSARARMAAFAVIQPQLGGMAKVERGRRAGYGGPAMSHTADPRVDAYIDALPDWQQAICREVRELVHAADPEVVETIKRTDRPYFVLQGNVCALPA